MRSTKPCRCSAATATRASSRSSARIATRASRASTKARTRSTGCIIPTRLLKQGESLLAQEVTTEATGSAFALASFGATGLLEAERQALTHVKRLARTALATAGAAFGAAVREQQEVLGARRRRHHRVLRHRERSRPGGEDRRTGQRARRDCGGHRARVRERCDGPRGPRRQADRECTGGIQRAHGATHRGRRPGARASWRRHGRRPAQDRRRGDHTNTVSVLAPEFTRAGCEFHEAPS